MPKKLRVGILFGGRSAEHEVSLQSARNIIAAADPQKYEVVPIEISKDGRWRLAGAPAGVIAEQSAVPGARKPAKLRAAGKHPEEVILPPVPSQGGALLPVRRLGSASEAASLDVVFPVLHGTFGEDGTVQGLLELAGIPYVGAGVLGSAVGMDKEVMKRLFKERGLPIGPYLAVRRVDFEAAPRRVVLAIEKRFRYPVFVKPANLGSSVGISKAHNRKELEEGLRTAAQYDRKLLVEKAIEGRELECSVLGNHNPIASVPGEVVPGHEFYDYADKYLEGAARLIVPAPLRPAQSKRVQQLAVAAFQAAECAGMARIDFFLERKTGRILVNEINTIPGFTAISMYPRLWEASGLPYYQLIDRLIELALERHQDQRRNRYSFERSGK